MLNFRNPFFTEPFPEKAATACGQAIERITSETQGEDWTQLKIKLNYPKSLASLGALQFDTFGWQKADSGNIWYCTVRGYQLQVVTAEPNGPLTEDNPFGEKERAGYRDFIRKWFVKSGGGIISCDYTQFSGIHAFETIAKLPLPKDKKGRTIHGKSYVYFLNVAHPSENKLYQIKLDVVDLKMGSIRDDIILDLLQKITDFSPKKIKKYYQQDPYKPNFKKGDLRTFAELEVFDEFFAWHPLSLIRNYFRPHIETTLALQELS